MLTIFQFYLSRFKQVGLRMLLYFGMACSVGAANAEKVYNEGNAAYLQGDLDIALKKFQEVVRLDSGGVASAYNAIGVVYSRKGDWRNAIENYSKAIRLDPKTASYYANRGGAYTDSGRITEAIKDLDKSISLDPKQAAALYNRASALIRRHGKSDYDRAIKDLNMAEALDFRSFKLYIERGWAYSRKGADQQARADLDKAIELVPKSVLRDYSIPSFNTLMSDLTSSANVVLEATGNEGVLKAQGSMEWAITGIDLSSGGLKEGKGEKSPTLKDNNWGSGAVHTMKGMLTINGYKFVSSVKSPLVFQIVRGKGYVHLRGEGLVISPAYEPIHLVDKNQSVTVKKPDAPTPEPDAPRIYVRQFGNVILRVSEGPRTEESDKLRKMDWPAANRMRYYRIGNQEQAKRFASEISKGMKFVDAAASAGFFTMEVEIKNNDCIATVKDYWSDYKYRDAAMIVTSSSVSIIERIPPEQATPPAAFKDAGKPSTPPIVLLDAKDTQAHLIGTWEVPNNGSILSLDAENHVTRRVDVGGRSRVSFATAEWGEMFYELKKDETSGMLSLFIKEGKFENKRFTIIAVNEDSFDALYDGDGSADERTIKWKRTSKEPSPLKPRQK